jgi:peptide-methionine (S)-S-oxide reductase
MSIIFYHNDEQKKLAEESRDRLQDERGRKVYTEIVPAAEFYPAEDYHQKYYLRQLPELMRELTAYYADFESLVNSTAAARLNGYAGGFGTPDTLEEELDSLGLSPRGVEVIRDIAGRGLIPACPSG